MGHGQGTIRDSSVSDTIGLESLAASWNNSRDDFGRLLQRGTTRKTTINVHGQFHDEPESSAIISATDIANRNEENDGENLQTPGEPEDELWDRYFLELRSYWQTHGDCNVPLQNSPNPMMSMWVTNQRLKRQVGGHLSKKQEAKLDAIGFLWEVPDENL
jgi:hypothetical protein